MFDAQSDGLSSPLAFVTNLIPSALKTTRPCPAAPRPEADATASMSPIPFSPDSTSSHLTGESGDSDHSSWRFIETPICSEDEHLPDAKPMPGSVEEKRPRVSFEELASRYRQNQHKQVRKKKLEQRLHATKVSIGVSARLVRMGTAIQRGLVDRLKHEDKVNFIALYHTLIDLQEPLDLTSRRHLHGQDSWEDGPTPREPAVDRTRDFFLQLSPQSRADLLGILQSARTDSQFVFERLCSLSPLQLSALVSSSISSWEVGGDFSFSQTSRSRNYSRSWKPNPALSVPFKDRVLAFERTDALSVLLFNVYAAPLDSDGPEAQLRLDMWSSVCAKLIADGASRSYALIDHILSLWAMGSDWKAKPKFELYLMDILQTGSFLLESMETPPGLNFDMEPPDPLRTDVAEEFFASTVDSLFQLLDDPDGGFPHSVLQLSKAILQKLDREDCRDRFLEFLFLQWFFSKFLYGALLNPEVHGILLDFHIRKDAREKLLGQVGFQARSQAHAVLRSLHHYPLARPTVRQHFESMIYRFTGVSAEKESALQRIPRTVFPDEPGSPAVSLVLSATDILTLLNALFPRAPSPVYNSQSPTSGTPTSPLSSISSRPETHGPSAFEPGFYRPMGHYHSRSTSQNNGLLSADIQFLSHMENDMSRGANRIRFELSDLGEIDIHHTLESASAEEWTVFSVSQNGMGLVWGLFSDSQPGYADSSPVDEVQSTTLGLEDNFEALQTAIVKLIQENPAGDHVGSYLQPGYDTRQSDILSLRERFNRAMAHCHHNSDFIGAHYWWNAARQLRRSATASPSQVTDDSWILDPMNTTCIRSLETSKSVIERCEADFVVLDRHTLQLQKTVKEMMATMAKLRNKMWYMTDVKNSMKYEDARNVALALKTMTYPPTLLRHGPSETRSRGGTRSLGASLLQKPELQVMNVMKAPSNLAGPTKLSDEQVDLIKTWLSHNGIDNFCKGEERIHRFCYEVSTSIHRFVGETMTEAPVLWASELFHKERAKYDNSRFVSFTSSLRSFGIGSDDSAKSPYSSTILRQPEPPRYTQESNQMNRNSSFQSLISDKWKVPAQATEVSSVIGDRAASITTGDSCSTFWSAPPLPTHYAPSASSLYSRPPSMLSETGVVQPQRRNDREPHGKAVFLDGLRRTLTSLLLSDLSSPVWSCGTETDAWFGNVLDQKRIQAQMKKRSRIQRFYAEYKERTERQPMHRIPSHSRRSRSLGPRDRGVSGEAECPPSVPSDDSATSQNGQFEYGTVFRHLVDVFSRHANPFVKLEALRNLRSLVIASLNSTNDDRSPLPLPRSSPRPRRRTSGIQRRRDARNSFSESGTRRHLSQDTDHIPASPAAESVIYGSRPSDYSAPTDSQIVDALREVILEFKPKTLFRDLQFISAFVPGETLKKTDSGTAFFQFGLAALSLKEEVCHGMVEIADDILSQEFSRRHPASGYEMHPRVGDPMKDAANMWIITAKEGNAVAQRELAILYLTHPELVPRVTLPLTLLRDTFKGEMMYHRDRDSKSDTHTMCLALHWMQLSANGGDPLAQNRLRELEEFESIA